MTLPDPLDPALVHRLAGELSPAPAAARTGTFRAWLRRLVTRLELRAFPETRRLAERAQLDARKANHQVEQLVGEIVDAACLTDRVAALEARLAELEARRP